MFPAKKIQQFFDSSGKVIDLSKLPTENLTYTAESGAALESQIIDTLKNVSITTNPSRQELDLSSRVLRSQTNRKDITTESKEEDIVSKDTVPETTASIRKDTVPETTASIRKDTVPETQSIRKDTVLETNASISKDSSEQNNEALAPLQIYCRTTTRSQINTIQLSKATRTISENYPIISKFMLASSNGTPVYFGAYHNFRFQHSRQQNVIPKEWAACKKRLKASSSLCNVNGANISIDIYGTKIEDVQQSYISETLGPKMNNLYEIQYHSAFETDSNQCWRTIAFLAGIQTSTDFSIGLICGPGAVIRGKAIRFARILHGLALCRAHQQFNIKDFRLDAMTRTLATDVYNRWGYQASNKAAGVVEKDNLEEIILQTIATSKGLGKIADGIPMRYLMDVDKHKTLLETTTSQLQACLDAIKYVDDREQPKIDYVKLFKDINVK